MNVSICSFPPLFEARIDHTFFPLTFTSPCTTNCFACLTLLANNALNIAESNLLSKGKYVICMYGVMGGIRGFSFVSSPAPLPLACSAPSYLAKYLWSIGTTAGRFLLNMLFHCFSRICSPW